MTNAWRAFTVYASGPPGKLAYVHSSLPASSTSGLRLSPALQLHVKMPATFEPGLASDLKRYLANAEIGFHTDEALLYRTVNGCSSKAPRSPNSKHLRGLLVTSHSQGAIPGTRRVCMCACDSMWLKQISLCPLFRCFPGDGCALLVAGHWYR